MGDGAQCREGDTVSLSGQVVVGGGQFVLKWNLCLWPWCKESFFFPWKLCLEQRPQEEKTITSLITTFCNCSFLLISFLDWDIFWVVICAYEWTIWSITENSDGSCDCWLFTTHHLCFLLPIVPTFIWVPIPNPQSNPQLITFLYFCSNNDWFSHAYVT